MSRITVRFDDLRTDGPTRAFGQPTEVIAAHDLPQVVPAIEAAEAAAASGSWVAGFLAYEAAPSLTEGMATNLPDPDLPLAWFGVFPELLQASPLEAGSSYTMGRWVAEVSPSRYRRHVARIRELIRRGDTYQANYTMRLRSKVEGDYLALYRDLAESQHGSYAAYIDTGDHVVVSASPELFFRWEGATVTCRPMKGTAPRGRWSEEDEERRARLALSEKDRAENVMIVDLVRNDLGRIAVSGTVTVPSLFDTERYDTVWQLTSTVSAEIRPEVGLLGILAATFPCGSVTGAPKIRTMEIIEELETSPRGLYCGAIGVLAPPGSGAPRAEFSVAIRTMVVSRHTGEAEYGIGGGVTYGSTPGGEHEEAALKGMILTRRSRPITLLETMRWDPDTGFHLLDRHLRRLRASALYFGIRYPEEEISTAVSGFRADEASRVRLLLGERGEVRLEHGLFQEPGSPVVLIVDTEVVDPYDPMRYHKTADRAAYDMARARHPDVDDVVLVTRTGEVAETTIANIAALIGDRWVTPPLGSGCLPGTYREELLEQGVLSEGTITVEDLISAEEVVVLNSVSGWRTAKLEPSPTAQALL